MFVLDKVAGEITGQCKAHGCDISKCGGTCHWFAMCDNDTAGTRSHPILGDVPICERCDANMSRRATTDA
jgi:hypothetical protein